MIPGPGQVRSALNSGELNEMLYRDSLVFGPRDGSIHHTLALFSRGYR